MHIVSIKSSYLHFLHYYYYYSKVKVIIIVHSTVCLPTQTAIFGCCDERSIFDCEAHSK